MDIKNITRFSKKPDLYEKGNAVMWTDEYISRQLLAVHLNENINLASRIKTSREKTINWILEKVPQNNLAILDLGCGPGLYAEEFAKLGHKVTGVDFSKNSIEHASEQAETKNLDIKYISKNYLELDFENQFDLVMMIYADLGVLLPDDRTALLSIVRKALKPGGTFIFDILNESQIEKKTSPPNWEAAEKGFWKDEPYLLLSNSFLYEKEKVILYQHNVIDEKENISTYRFWTHFFTDEELTSMLLKNGFEDISHHRKVLPDSDIWNGTNVTFTVAKKGE